MELNLSIAAILGRREILSAPDTHKWNQLVGIELELESVTASDGNPLGSEYRGDYPWEDDDDWSDLDDDEREDRVNEWHSRPNVGGVPVGWTTHNDASLRNGLEFVTDRPIHGDAVDSCISSFYGARLGYTTGPRTSTHIHVNMMDVNVPVLQSLVMLTYTIEDALYRIVDEDRKWGGYSVALTEMPTSRLRNILNPSTQQSFVRAINPPQNAQRYFGLNCNIARHGTVEFRYFPGGPSEKELREWVDLVTMLKNTAVKYHPEQLSLILSSPEALEKFLVDELGYWGSRFIMVTGGIDMFDTFEQVNALRTEGSNPERVASIITIRPEFANLLQNKLLKNHEEAVGYINSHNVFGPVVALDDATYYLLNALRMVPRASSGARYQTFSTSEFEELLLPNPPLVERSAELSHRLNHFIQSTFDEPLNFIT